jgi:hypothetical protein
VNTCLNQRFQAAVEGLATSTLGWRERLINAASHVLVIHCRDFPEDLKEEYGSLKRALTRLDGVPSAMKATVAQMKEEDGREVMKRIYLIYDRLRAGCLEPMQ